MNKHSEVLIIGGGVIGVCAAYYLAKRGRKVILLEKRDICAGSSYGNAGLTAYGLAIPIAAPGVLSLGLRWLLIPDSPFHIKPRFDLGLLRWLSCFSAACNETRMRNSIPVLLDLGQASKDLFDALYSRKDLEFGYKYEGRLYLYNSEEGFDEGVAAAKLLGEFGVQTRVMNGNAARQLEPSALPNIVGGIHFLDYGHLIPDRFVHAMARAAEQYGADICTATEVIGFDTSGESISGVMTTRGVFRPKQVVLAAGALSPLLANDLGLRITLQPAKGYSATFACPGDWPRLPLALEEERLAVTRMGSGLRISGFLELSGYDPILSKRKLEALRVGVSRYLTDVDALELKEFWSGFRPLTPDGLPIIGRSPSQDNLIIATGHGMLGITHGPITGHLVSQLVVGETPQIDLSPLGVERFG